MTLTAGETVLFQGDSITDAGRRESSDGLGNGYPAIVAGRFAFERPDQRHRVLNRGMGGDRTVELLARWDEDCLGLKPDLLSISIGVNDVWRLRGEWMGQTFVPGPAFEENYRLLLDRAIRAGVTRFALLSPTTIDEEVDPELAAELDDRTQRVRKLAAEANAVYVPMREAFLRALKSHPTVAWTLDGCHPTIAGHGLMASTWWDAVVKGRTSH